MIHQHIKRVATEVDENNYIVVLPEMVANENAAFQEEEIQNDEWMYRYYKSMFQFKLDNLCIQVPPGSKVLDVCCGRGYLGQFFMEKGCHVTFCDLSPFQLTELKNRLANSEYKYDVIEANVEALPFEDGKFDFVVGNSFLHHFQNVPKGLSEITRMIRSGGGLILFHEPTVYANFYESFPLSLFKNTLPKNGFIDVWQFDVKSLQTVLAKTELHSLTLKGSGVLPYIVLNWYFILLNKIGFKSRFYFEWARWANLYLLRLEQILFFWLPLNSFPSVSIFALKK